MFREAEREGSYGRGTEEEEIKITVYEKKSAMLGDSCFVLSETGVIAAMPRFDSVNSQNAELLAVSRYHHAVARAQVLLRLIQIIVYHPSNGDRLVALRNGACSRNSFVEIHFFIAEREGRDGR